MTTTDLEQELTRLQPRPLSDTARRAIDRRLRLARLAWLPWVAAAACLVLAVSWMWQASVPVLMSPAVDYQRPFASGDAFDVTIAPGAPATPPPPPMGFVSVHYALFWRVAMSDAVIIGRVQQTGDNPEGGLEIEIVEVLKGQIERDRLIPVPGQRPRMDGLPLAVQQGDLVVMLLEAAYEEGRPTYISPTLAPGFFRLAGLGIDTNTAGLYRLAEEGIERVSDSDFLQAVREAATGSATLAGLQARRDAGEAMLAAGTVPESFYCSVGRLRSEASLEWLIAQIDDGDVSTPQGWIPMHQAATGLVTDGRPGAFDALMQRLGVFDSLERWQVDTIWQGVLLRVAESATDIEAARRFLDRLDAHFDGWEGIRRVSGAEREMLDLRDSAAREREAAGG